MSAGTSGDAEARLVALRSVAVSRWLRHHPLVEAGPGVRGSQALAEMTAARRQLLPPSTSTTASASENPGDRAFLAAALVALPHRLRVRPGADADALVRQAVAEALVAPPGARAAPAPGEEDTDRGDADAGDERLRVMVPFESEGHRPATADEERALRAAFGDDEAARVLDELLGPGAALPPAAGPAPTRPARRAVGEEVLAVRPFRPGDRARD
ncbi:MAG TPA: hypothetical protein VHL53_19090, partial [Acidimicrobiia bacterium]|nr:hypothetical protein [Acidimicrobiia bacterium]